LAVDPTQRIGHTSIEEIANHAWFAGISPETPPPFIPEFSSELDTGYFEQRYAFNPEEDLSVLKDLRSQTPSAVSSFSSMGLGQLQRRNKQMAESSGLAPFGSHLRSSNSASNLRVRARQAVGSKPKRGTLEPPGSQPALPPRP
jgi:hypothetical protein